VLQRIEVKGEVSAAFTSVELTANKLAAAEAYGDAHWLCPMVNCETAHPKRPDGAKSSRQTNGWRLERALQPDRRDLQFEKLMAT
jgi:hypothetical protein